MEGEDLTAGAVDGTADLPVGVPVEGALEPGRGAPETTGFLDLLLAGAPVGFGLTDREHRFLKINQALAELSGLPVEMHLGRTLREVLPALADTMEALNRQVLETGVPILNVEISGKTRAAPGEVRHWLASYFPVRAPGGQLVGTGTVVTEITSRKRVEETLRAGEANYRRIVETAYEGVWTTDADGITTYVNHRMAEMLGYVPDEMLGRSALDFVFPEDQASVARQLEQRRHGVREVGDLRLRHREGTELWATVSGAPLYGEGREYLGALAMLTDVTARRRVEAGLRFLAESSEILAASLDFQATLATLARVVIPTLADCCVIHGLAKGGEVRQLAVAHVEPAAEELLREGQRDASLDPQAPVGPARVLRTGEPEVHPGPPPWLSTPAEGESPFLQRLRDLGPTSYLCVSLPLRGRTLGAMSLFHCASGRRHAPEDLALAQELARRAALAIDNARLYWEAQEAEARIERQAWRLEVLAEASRAFEEARLDLPAVLDTVSQTVTGLLGLGDAYVLRLISEDGQWLEPVVVHHGDPQMRRFLKELLDAERLRVGDGLAGQVALTGEPVLIPETQPAELRARIGPEYQPYLDRFGLYGVLIVPLRVRGQVIGTLFVSRDQPGRAYTVDDQVFLQELAARAATAIDNARLHRQAVLARERLAEALNRERRIADELQECFRPRVPPQIAGYHLGHVYQPAWDEAFLGGDFYDLFQQRPGRYGIVIGDVSGKGLDAAVHTVKAKYYLRGYAAEYREPGMVVRLLNDVLYEEMASEGHFLTLFYGLLDVRHGRLTYVMAGHEVPLLLVPGSPQVLELERTGPLVGGFPNLVYEERTVDLPPGSSLLLYTDGVTDARRAGTFLQVEGLKQRFMAQAAVATGQDLVDRLLAEVEAFAHGVLRDDVALLLIQRNP